MKTRHSILLLLTVFFLQHNIQAQTAKAHTAKPPPKIKSAAFSGIWKGSEKCSAASAPVAIITILTNGPSAVLIKGMYSTAGRIKGSIKGNQVIIELQEVQDPNFHNLAISGTLTLSDDRKSLVASFAVQNNNNPDACTATYVKGSL